MMCPTCGKDGYVSDELAAIIAVLPKGLEPYDFGGGSMVMPVPDFMDDQGTYLTTYIGGIFSQKDGLPDEGLFFTVKWRDQQSLIADFARAGKMWEQNKRPFAEAIRSRVSLEAA